MIPIFVQFSKFFPFVFFHTTFFLLQDRDFRKLSTNRRPEYWQLLLNEG